MTEILVRCLVPNCQISGPHPHTWGEVYKARDATELPAEYLPYLARVHDQARAARQSNERLQEQREKRAARKAQHRERCAKIRRQVEAGADPFSVLPRAVVNSLKRGGYTTAAQVAELSDSDLLRLRNIGKGSWDYVRAAFPLEWETCPCCRSRVRRDEVS